MKLLFLNYAGKHHMQTLDQCLKQLLREGRISLEAARAKAVSPDQM